MTLFGCTLYRASFTRAQWLWSINLVCLIVHSVFAWLAFNSCNATRFGQRVNENCTAVGMSIPVTRLAINWTATSAGGYDVTLVDNGMPVRIDFLTGWFFLISAIFHAFAVIAGPFDRLAPNYWKQLDNALAYWRWIEYSASASVMVLALFLVSGIREQNSLAMAFVLMWSVQMFGLLTEVGSRPDKRESDGYRSWCGDPVRTDALLMIERKKRAYRDRNNGSRDEGPREYAYDQTMAMQSATTRYQWENQRLSDMPPPMTYDEQKVVRAYAMGYTRNYVRRMIPHVLGIVPYVTVWVIFLNGFFTQLSDLKQGDADLFSQVPSWVPVAIVGTVIIFTSFTFVQWRYQWLSPDYYWKTGTSPASLPSAPTLQLTPRLHARRTMVLSAVPHRKNFPRWFVARQRAGIRHRSRGTRGHPGRAGDDPAAVGAAAHVWVKNATLSRRPCHTLL
jgi:hypothetical protein